VRWLPLVVLSVLPLYVLVTGIQPISDPDPLWHVLLGRALWRTWQFQGPDPLGGLAPLPHVYHQWLPELGMAAADHVSGLAGVAWLAAAMYAGLLVALYALARVRGSTLAATLATVVALVGVGGSVSPRPQIVGFALLAVTLAAWMRTRSDSRIRWWLVPLTWVWACCHGTWVLGPALALLFAVGLALDRRVDRAGAARAGLVALLSLVAGALTPVGPSLLLTPLAIRTVSPYIGEWQPAPLTNPALLAAVGMLLVVAIFWARSRRRVSATDLLLWLVALGSALLYARTIAVAAVIATPLVAGALQSLLPERPATRRHEWTVLLVSTVAVLLAVGVAVPRTASSMAGVPDRLDSVLAGLPSGTRIFTVDSLGGWLWYAHANVVPTMDTRAEIYGAAYVDAYAHALNAYPGWRDTVGRSGARYALLASDGPLADALEHQSGWTPVGVDSGFVLLGAP
jgi:hypothetical protein